jgi:Rps23 Pro-64 3,4-dihydroxylase Tpa1-like proline 4-hydroxylase
MGNTWAFNGCSTDNTFSFWNMDLTQDVFFTTHMLNKIKMFTEKNFALGRVYANGQTYGLCGSYHQDVESNDKESYKTFLYYVNPFWDYQWGGSTIFHQAGENHNQLFIPNNGVLFDSTIYHAGLEPTRHCKELRVTVAFKLIEEKNGIRL